MFILFKQSEVHSLCVQFFQFGSRQYRGYGASPESPTSRGYVVVSVRSDSSCSNLQQCLDGLDGGGGGTYAGCTHAQFSTRSVAFFRGSGPSVVRSICAPCMMVYFFTPPETTHPRPRFHKIQHIHTNRHLNDEGKLGTLSLFPILDFHIFWDL